MSNDDFYTPTDIDALRMENELLAYEARFLRTRLAERVADRVEELERSEARLKDLVEHYERQLEASERTAAELRDRLAEAEPKAERAEQDIVLLLRRLANSPFGWFFSTKQNFRILEQRYLGDDA